MDDDRVQHLARRQQLGRGCLQRPAPLGPIVVGRRRPFHHVLGAWRRLQRRGSKARLQWRLTACRAAVVPTRLTRRGILGRSSRRRSLGECLTRRRVGQAGQPCDRVLHVVPERDRIEQVLVLHRLAQRRQQQMPPCQAIERPRRLRRLLQPRSPGERRRFRGGERFLEIGERGGAIGRRLERDRAGLLQAAVPVVRQIARRRLRQRVDAPGPWLLMVIGRLAARRLFRLPQQRRMPQRREGIEPGRHVFVGQRQRRFAGKRYGLRRISSWGALMMWMYQRHGAKATMPPARFWPGSCA